MMQNADGVSSFQPMEGAQRVPCELPAYPVGWFERTSGSLVDVEDFREPADPPLPPVAPLEFSGAAMAWFLDTNACIMREPWRPERRNDCEGGNS